MLKKSKEMLKNTPVRFQVSFNPEYEPDICKFLHSTRASDRHGIITQALRLLMRQTGFYDMELLEAKMGNMGVGKTPPKPGKASKGRKKSSKTISKEDLKDMKEIGDAF